MSIGLTDDEKARIRYHMGYPMLTYVATFSIGVPIAFETSFIIEGAMNLVAGPTLTRVQTLLCRLEETECQMHENIDLAVITKLDEIGIDPNMQRSFKSAYAYWQNALGNVLSVPVNPFDQRRGGGLNVPVSG